MSDTRKFGTWLLDQSERQDTTGTLARAWQHLRDANGHVRQTSAKAIGELMKGALGEDWDRLRGDESMAEAVKEWERRNAPGEQQVSAPAPAAVPSDPEPYYTATAEPAVLVLNGVEHLLEPGHRYELRLRDVTQAEQTEDRADLALVGARAATDSGNRTPLSDVRAQYDVPETANGRTDWAALWGMADHTVPQSDGYDPLYLDED